MELRAFAEQILFATTLEEKLRGPQAITDDNPGPAIAAPSVPGRPAGLKFKEPGSSAREFPTLQRLEDEQERGRLLHFFANHELLATELMALVLLRFPEAPAAFRRGVLKTLQDEQEHTRWYLDRMRACGVEFGDLPVSGYFWRAVSGMESPMDYVAGLSLTFEQANLDFARHFAGAFSQVGDAPSAALLEKIYRDEIAHVAYGLKWFRRWKNPTESDWDAFCRQLKFPLSPQRAKGFAVNFEGRRAAGLDPRFIAELDVFAHSKGRTPSVFHFNPFAEGRMAQGKSFTPSKQQTQLAHDLSSLPQFLCRQDDILLVPQRPAVEFLSSLKQAGFALPEFVELSRGKIADDSPIADRKLGALRPWAWGPDSVELLSPLLPKVTGETRTAEQRFNPAIGRLYSKAFSAELLRTFLSQISAEPWLSPLDTVGTPVRTLEQAVDAVSTIRARNHHKVVIKQALGLAGQNAIRLWEPVLLETQKRWIANACDNGRELVVEPWLERVADFSVQLEMTGEGMKLRGFTSLLNDAKGHFLGNAAAPDFARRLPQLVYEHIKEPRDISVRLHALYEALFRLLETELRKAGYVGPIGIDAFSYRDSHGEVRIKPLVEINPRYTMGRVVVELMKNICPGSSALFRIVSRPMLAAGQTFLQFAEAERRNSPVVLEGTPRPRIREGWVCLTDPARAEICLATLQVSRTPRP